MINLYKGIVASDKFLHSKINEILNLFEGSIVKILSNTKVAKYSYKDGVKDQLIGYDYDELNRNQHGSANLLVKKNNGQYYTSHYFYVTKSIIYQENEANPYLTLPEELVKVGQKHKDNTILAYSHLDNLWFMVKAGKIYDYYIENVNNEKIFYRYRGFKYVKYELDLSKGKTLSNKPNPNAKYYENAHIGVTRYTKSISGKHCWIKVFSKATGNPVCKRNGLAAKPTECKSLREAWNMLDKWIHFSGEMSEKTFIRKVRSGEIFEYKDFYFQVVENEAELLTRLDVIEEKHIYNTVVEAFASFGVVISKAELDIAARLNMTVDEFNEYCLKKYSDDSIIEAVLPEDVDAIDMESADKSESWYRNLKDESDYVDLHIGEEEINEIEEAVK